MICGQSVVLSGFDLLNRAEWGAAVAAYQKIEAAVISSACAFEVAVSVPGLSEAGGARSGYRRFRSAAIVVAHPFLVLP